MIRKMELADVARVAEIHVFSWRDTYRGIVADDILLNRMLVVNRMQYFDNAVRSNTEDSYVYDDGIIKAILTIGPCRDEDKRDSFELWGLYADPFIKGQGIGSKMVRFCEQRAIDNGFADVRLWVLEKNENARRFYEKLGYTWDGSEKWIEGLHATEIRYGKQL